MTTQQKVIIAALATVALCIFISLGYIILTMFQSPLSGAAVAAQSSASTSTSPPPPTSTPTPTATPMQLATPVPTIPPTPINTPVVTVTIPPTPLPTPVNCIDDITGFEASGVITNEEVVEYIRRTIPVSHLDNCLGIRYIPQFVTIHSTPAAGRFIPLFRQISVYGINPEYQDVEDVLDTLIHEIGHNVHYNIRLEDLEVADQWGDLHDRSHATFAQNGTGFVSDYARTNEFEDFADSYLVYVRYPEILESISPEKYEYIRQIAFKGQEYTP